MIFVSAGVMVIATATQPQAMDAALRRPGRLSHDVCLGVPPPSARRDILHRLLQGSAHSFTCILYGHILLVLRNVTAML